MQRRQVLKHLVGGAAAFSALGRASAAEEQPGARGHDFQVRLADGRSLGCRMYGSRQGAPMLYFHGAPTCRLETQLFVRKVPAEILAQCCLVSVDRPGLGLSDYQGGRTLLHWPADVAELVASPTMLQLNPQFAEGFSLIGVSTGVGYACACLNDQRVAPRVKTAALVSSHAPMHSPGVEPGYQDGMVVWLSCHPRLGSMGLNFVARRLCRNPCRAVPRLVAGAGGPDERLLTTSEGIRAFQETFLEAMRRGPAGALRDISLLARPWGFSLKNISFDKPVRVWHGGRDGTAPLSHGQYVHAQLPAAGRIPLHYFPEEGHATLVYNKSGEILEHVLADARAAR